MPYRHAIGAVTHAFANLKKVMAKATPLRSPALAQRAAALLAERGGLIRDMAIDMKGLETVLALRSKYGEPRKALTDASKYVDLTFHERAFGGR